MDAEGARLTFLHSYWSSHCYVASIPMDDATRNIWAALIARSGLQNKGWMLVVRDVEDLIWGDRISLRERVRMDMTQINEFFKVSVEGQLLGWHYGPVVVCLSGMHKFLSSILSITQKKDGVISYWKLRH